MHKQARHYAAASHGRDYVTRQDAISYLDNGRASLVNSITSYSNGILIPGFRT